MKKENRVEYSSLSTWLSITSTRFSLLISGNIHMLLPNQVIVHTANNYTRIGACVRRPRVSKVRECFAGEGQAPSRITDADCHRMCGKRQGVRDGLLWPSKL